MRDTIFKKNSSPNTSTMSKPILIKSETSVGYDEFALIRCIAIKVH